VNYPDGLSEIEELKEHMDEQSFYEHAREFTCYVHGEQLSVAIPRRIYIIKHNKNVVDMSNTWYDFFLDNDDWEQRLMELLNGKSDMCILTFLSLWSIDTYSPIIRHEVELIRAQRTSRFFTDKPDGYSDTRAFHAIETTLKETIHPLCCFL